MLVNLIAMNVGLFSSVQNNKYLFIFCTQFYEMDGAGIDVFAFAIISCSLLHDYYIFLFLGLVIDYDVKIQTYNEHSILKYMI
jgi:hypothetical protein